MAEKRKKTVNTVFISLIVVTLILGLLGCALDFASYKEFGDDAKYLYAFAAIIYPVLALFVFSSEVFLWRSVAFFVSYPGHRRVELVLRILLAAGSAATLGYWVYYVLVDPTNNSTLPLYAFGFQILCQFLIWICQIVRWTAECVAMCKRPVERVVCGEQSEPEGSSDEQRNING